MAVYLDTSAFVKLVARERNTAALRAWLGTQDDDLVSSDLLRTEALRAAKRHSLPAVRRTRDLLSAVTLIHVTTDICERAAELDPAILRSLDALHLATALTFGDSLAGVVTYDDRLASACELHGVRTLAPGQRGAESV